MADVISDRAADDADTEVAGNTATPGLATAGFQPPLLMIAKIRPETYSDNNMVPPGENVPRWRRAARESRHPTRYDFFTLAIYESTTETKLREPR